MSQLEALALRMGRARRRLLDARKLYRARTGLEADSPATTNRLIAEMSAARIEWRKASSALWRLVAKMDAAP